MTATVEDVGRGGGEQDSQRGCACSHNSRGASLGELQATAPLERTTTMKFSPAFVSLLSLVPFVAAAGVHKLPLKKLAPAASNTALETAYLAEKYGAQSSFQMPMAGAGGSGRRLRFSDNERDDDLFWTQQEDVNAQKGHGVPLTSKLNIALSPDLVTNAPQTS